MYMNCELNDAEIWLRTTQISNEQQQQQRTDTSSESLSNASGDIYRYYFLSVARVSYGREALLSTNGNEREKDTPTHKLVVYDLKGAWTKDNRDVAFALFDSLVKSQKLKNNLATEALKCFRKEGGTAGGGGGAGGSAGSSEGCAGGVRGRGGCAEGGRLAAGRCDRDVEHESAHAHRDAAAGDATAEGAAENGPSTLRSIAGAAGQWWSVGGSE